MQTNLYFRVCVPCRNVNAQYTVIEDAEGNFVERLCKTCGGQVVLSPYKWAPPKKRDDRAWKRIANGEWLWDRRRTRRAYGQRGWANYHHEEIPRKKKGAQTRYTGGYRTDAQVELGS